MAINSKNKGATFERKLSSLFREYGYDTHRTAQYCGNSGQAQDIMGLPYISVEAKARKEIAVCRWMEQAIRDATANGGGNKPTVFMKENFGEVLVLMRFTDWMELYREWEAGKTLENETDFKSRQDQNISDKP